MVASKGVNNVGWRVAYPTYIQPRECINKERLCKTSRGQAQYLHLLIDEGCLSHAFPQLLYNKVKRRLKYIDDDAVFGV